ncbi:aminotransferase class V-fold PLP-dependent enzyme [Actinoplanes sp. NPDC051411]|uniref:aminotransferase class V-fold PLP-dependent enzyme n=1 Tax=Actinoplanes sp. NPDC051411 TaxID=3155522 RepID=UPI0034320A1B
MDQPLTREFGSLEPGRAWFNTAHQGPLPSTAVEASSRAAEMKANPCRLPDSSFSEVPEVLRARLATLVGGAVDEIVLGNSTSYGLHLIANGLSFAPDDEVLTVEGDYPATVLPWQRVARVRSVPASELPAAIAPRTRVMAVTWVDSFTGRALDLSALGRACRERGVWLVVNGSQAVGARPVDVRSLGVDALVSCGYKWLCGPYGTGFAWLSPALRDTLRPQQAYWLAMQGDRGLDHMRDTRLRDDLGVRGFDVFCPAAFATSLPWIASLDLFLAAGVDSIARYDQELASRLLAGIDPSAYSVVSPSRSALVVLSRRDGTAFSRHRLLTSAGIDTAYREGNLRFSLHTFNTVEQVDRALDALHIQDR